MKYYETIFEEYLQSVQKCDFHPEITPLLQTIPAHKDVIFYGPSGIGKYSQVLKYLQPLSPSKLKYYKKITVFIDRVKNKTPYTLFMSDIHFEIDLAVLGCNAKKVWHEIFIQLVDIIKLRENKFGYLVCKNFHTIHSELLEIFYSYMQHYRPREVSLPNSANGDSQVQIAFLLLTEHLSFIPNPIYQSSCIVPIQRPAAHLLEKGLELCAPNPEKEDAVIINESTTPTPTKEPKTAKQFLKRIHPKKPSAPSLSSGYAHSSFHNNNNKFHNPLPETNTHALLQQIDTSQVLNLKEYFCFNLLPNTPQHQQPQTQPQQPTPKKQSTAPQQTQNSLSYLSEDIFNKVCDQIIDKITQIPVQDTAKWFASFRDALYSILICNLDASECICYILQHFIHHPPKTSPFSGSPPPGLSATSVANLMQKMYPFLLYYNNNYRPIYHLEIIFLRLIVEIYHFTPIAPFLAVD
jgi:hypothetical protein